MSRLWGVLGVAFSATGTEMAIRDIVSWPALGRYLGGLNGDPDASQLGVRLSLALAE
jgi:hypothetical protein